MTSKRLTTIELIAILVLAGGQLVTMINSGMLTPFGLSFWGPHGHDAVFHLALIQRFAFAPWSLANPLMSGTALTNYHLVFDYLSGLFVRLSGISVYDWYFRLWPVILAASLGLLLSRLLREYGFSLGSRLLALLLVFWGGSLGHLANVVAGGSLWGGESRFWSTQGISVLINPPLALSLILLVLWLLGFNRWQRQPSWRWGLVLTALTGLMFQTKAYAAVLLTASLLMASLWQGWMTGWRKTRPLLWLNLAMVMVTGIGYLLTTSGGEQLFVLAPLYLVQAMLGSPDRLNLVRLAQAWDNYLSGGQILKLTLLQLAAVAVFISGNFGVRLLALANTKLDLSRRLLWSLVGIGLVIPLLFIQRGTTWNTIQFLYYSLFVTAILAAPVWKRLLTNSRRLPEFLVKLGLLFFLALPTSWGTLRDYLSPVPASIIPYDELAALDLIDPASGPVLQPLYRVEAGRSYAEPKPLSVYESTAYVSAYTGAVSVLADEVNLKIMNYDFNNRKRDLARFYTTTDRDFGNEFLAETGAEIIYQTDHFRPRLALEALGFSPVFDSGRTLVYTRNK